MLVELHVSCSSSPQIFCDNIGAIYLSVNPMFHSKMKHISIDYHFVCDHGARGYLRVSHISSKDQFADALTKSLSSYIFRKLRSKISVSSGSIVLRGLVRECLSPQNTLPDSLDNTPITALTSPQKMTTTYGR